MSDSSISHSQIWTRRVFPFLWWWPYVNRATVKSDLSAGLTNAVIVLPQGVAFALLAGLPPEYGLYTAMVPAIVAALFGSSHHLISGPTTAISLVVFATVSKFAAPGSAEFIRLALTLAFLAGAYQLILGLIRMGAVTNFVSHSVVVGFTAGAAVLIATSQLRHFFGLDIPAGESFVHTWQNIFTRIDEIQLLTASIAGLTLLVAGLLAYFRPQWPGMLIALTIGSLGAALLGGEESGINLIGELGARLPPLSTPDLSLGTLKSLGSGALAIAMLGLAEAVSIGRSIGLKSGQHINSNQEFIGQGLANITGSFFSSFASSGSFTRSGINFTAGAVTPLAAIFAAGALGLIVLLFAPLAAYLPIAAIAGLLLIVAWRLIDAHHIYAIVRTSGSETAVLLTTFLATLFLELEFAIYAGVLLSLILYLMRTSRPRIVACVPDPATANRHLVNDPKLPECPQLKILRIDGSLFFGAIDHVQNALQDIAIYSPQQKHLLIVSNGINFIDIAGAEMLVQRAQRRRAIGGGFYLSKLKDEACDIFQRGGYAEKFGRENIYKTKGEAIAGVFRLLNRSICERCDKRIFLECQGVPSVTDKVSSHDETRTAADEQKTQTPQ